MGIDFFLYHIFKNYDLLLIKNMRLKNPSYLLYIFLDLISMLNKWLDYITMQGRNMYKILDLVYIHILREEFLEHNKDRIRIDLRNQ